MKPPRRKKVIYKPVKDLHARTDKARKIWLRYVNKWFPDARETRIESYGFLVKIEHPHPEIKEYTIVWRYGGIPSSMAERTAILDWLRSAGENMSRLSMVRYRQGLVHTMNT